MARQWEVYLLPKISAIVAVTTIIICYIIATHLKHVQPWLPDITHCARYAPERFIFRIGMIPAASAISLMWFVIWGWVNDLAVSRPSYAPTSQAPAWVKTMLTTTHIQKIACTLGVIAGGCLVVSSSVLESDGSTVWPIHVLCATSFFILMLAAQVLLTYRFYEWSQAGTPVISEMSLLLKMGCAGFTGVIFLLDIYFQITKVTVYSNLCEWTMTFAIVGYNLTFVPDWKGRLFVTFPSVAGSPVVQAPIPAPIPTPVPAPVAEQDGKQQQQQQQQQQQYYYVPQQYVQPVMYTPVQQQQQQQQQQ